MHKSFFLRLSTPTIGLMCLCLGLELLAQRPSSGRFPGGQGDGQGADFGDVIFSEDTLDVKYYFLEKPERKFVYQDTFIQYFHEYNLDRIRGPQYFGLGYPTSPVRSVVPLPTEQLGYHLGLTSYQPYRINDHNFRFYQIKKALTYASYVQGQSQNDGIFRVLFARDFKDGLQISLAYNRANNLGIYRKQAGQQTNLGVGMRYVSKNKNFQVHGVHYANTFSQENNGGITNDTSFLGELGSERLNIPIYLEGAETRDQERTYQIKGTYRLAGRDSVQSSQGLLASVQLKSEERIFKFFDRSPSLTYYGNYWTHDQGVRNFIKHNNFSTHFNLRFAGAKPNQLFQVGIKNVSHQVDLDATKENINDWIVTSALQWALKDRLTLEATGDFGTNRRGSFYALKGEIGLDLGVAGRLTGSLQINQRLPSQIESHLFLSQSEIWQTDFKNVLNNHLSARYELPSLDFWVKAGQIISSNPIYFTSTAVPDQIDGLASLTYLRIFKSFKLGSFVNENQIILQQPGNTQIFRLPRWHTRNSLYFDGYLFKKILNLKTGFEFLYHDSFEGISYAPFIGQWTVDSENSITSYPALDYHLAIRVGFLRAFVLLENFLQPFQDIPYFQTSRYPGQDFTLRIGLSWIFIN